MTAGTITPVTAGEAEVEPPNGWTWELLTDVAELATGHTPDRKRPEYWDGDIPWVNLTEIRRLDGRVAHGTDLTVSPEGIRHSSAVVLPAGTVCFSRTASIGFVTIMGRAMSTSQDFVNWICGDRLDPHYLMRALLASRERLRLLSSGSTHKTIYVRVAERFRVLVPPIDEQRRIVRVLERADALRSSRREGLSLLDSLTEAMFHDLFGDPVLNPQDFEGCRLGQLLRSATYGSSRKAGPAGALPMLRMGNLTTTGQIDLSDMKYVDLPDSEIEKHTVVAGDVLFNRTNSADLVGKSALYRGDLPMAYAGYLIRLRSGEQIHPEYLAAYLNLRSTKEIFRARCRSIVGMANINAKELQALWVPVPPLELQKEFALRVQARLAHESLIGTGAAELDELFASLQQRAFRGDL